MISRKLKGRASKAFTLIELLIVVLLLGILIAIAVPSLFSSTQKAENRAAQTTLSSAVTTIRSYSTDTNSLSGLTVAKLNGMEPNIAWADTAAYPAGGGARGVAVGAVSTAGATAGKTVTIWSPGTDTLCWGVEIHVNDGDPDRYGYTTVTPGTPCTGPLPTTAAAEGSPSGSQPRTFPAAP